MAITSMNIESTDEEGTLPTTQPPKTSNNSSGTSTSETKKAINWPILLLSCFFMAIGTIGSPLLTRLYYLHGGSRKWISTFTQSAGFPILLLPLFILFFQSTYHQGLSPSLFFMERKLFLFSAVTGIFVGLSNFMYTLGLSYLPVSTSSLLFATQLAFIAVFARIIVKQKFTAFSINSVVLMTLGSAMLGLRASGDRPAGVSNRQYLLGFFLTLGSAALTGLLWPCIELCYSKAKRGINYTVVMQFQLNVAVFATIFSIIGMAIHKDFQAIRREANAYGLGNGVYIVVLISSAVTWQFVYIGGFGVIFCIGSLFNGILTSVLLPMTEIAAVIAYHENFTGEKGMALALCLWGFTSYFYGEYKNNRKLSSSTHHVQVAVDE